jgi:hypothetical protein
MNRHQRRAAPKEIAGLLGFSFVFPDRKAHDQIEASIKFDGENMWFVINGQKMARRENRHWIPLVPGFEIHDNLYGGSIDDLDECQGTA